jgi:hypothetical protein
VVATGLGADNRITAELRAWVRTGDVQAARAELIEAVRNAMIEMGIGTPTVAREIRVVHQGAEGLTVSELLGAPLTAPAIKDGEKPQ